MVEQPFTEVGISEGVNLRGGYMKEPVWVPTQFFEGHVFVRIRQYDDWLVWMVCNSSRKANTLRPSKLWQKLLAALDGTLAQPEDDPMADIMKSMEAAAGPSKKRPRQRAPKEPKSQGTVRTVEHEESPGSKEMRTLTLFLDETQKKVAKTVWLCSQHLPWFIQTLYQEAYKQEPVVFTEGVRWLEGSHAWVANWRGCEGHKTERAYVMPWIVRSGEKLWIEEDAFQEKTTNVRAAFAKKILGLGFPEDKI